jgi:hypothetical protein
VEAERRYASAAVESVAASSRFISALVK